MIRRLFLVVVGGILLLATAGCKSKAASESASNEANKPKIYSLTDVDNELKEAGVQMTSTQEELRNFFKMHPNYQVCQDTDYMLVARMRNSKVDAHASDQYIFATYRDGKIAEFEIGPPEFSVGNLASYCH